MRIYQNVLEAVKEVERDLFEMGILAHAQTYQDQDVANDPGFDTKELTAYQYMVTSVYHHLPELLAFFGLGEDYARAELADRLDPTDLNPGIAWLLRPEVWREFRQADGYFAYTYNERIRTQIARAADRLLRDPDSRQVVITIYDQHQDLAQWGGGGRVPCSMYYHFMSRVREGVRALDCVYHMRSCDFYTHFGYDVYLAISLQLHMATLVGSNAGWFIHSIDSLHAFRKDWDKKGEIF